MQTQGDADAFFKGVIRFSANAECPVKTLEPQADRLLTKY
jgi:hypothetical protein